MQPTALIWNTRIKNWQNRLRIHNLARQVVIQSRRRRIQSARPVVFFNASTRIAGVSQNAAFAFLLSSSLQLAGISVVHFACKSGLSRCVQGTNKDDPSQPMPCKACISLSAQLYSNGLALPFTYTEQSADKACPSHTQRLVDEERRIDLARLLENLSTAEMAELEFPFPQTNSRIPLGELVVPSLRWILRRHHLPDDEATRKMMREMILSAHFTAGQFHQVIETIEPQAAVIFNGLLFPEAAACWVARAHGLRTITHEVGYQRFSAFFTDGDATAYPIRIPEDYELSPEQNARLDAYLEERFQGQFTMAGIRFWPEMRGLDEAFVLKMQGFQQVVPIFTNVVFDTSQVHANTVFPHMFAWLDLLLQLMRRHPETLFVIRAHPDEMRPGSRKQSRESVREWVQANRVLDLPNVVFIDSQEYVSSYELIQKAKFVMVYNSSIGLEAAIMGAAVLSGGKARYTQVLADTACLPDTKRPVVFFPQSQQAFQDQAEEFLRVKTIAVPAEFKINARTFLYFQLYKSSISFEPFLTASPRAGFVHLKKFHWSQLLPENSPAMQILVNGIVNRKPFLSYE
jgi:hypothetical protein